MACRINKESSQYYKLWQHKTNLRRITMHQIGFDSKKAQWDVIVENGRGKIGFTTKSKAMAFVKSKMKEYD